MIKKTRQEAFCDFVRQQPNFDKYIKDLVAIGDKVFIIRKGLNSPLWYSYFEEFKLHGAMFNMTEFYDSTLIEDKSNRYTNQTFTYSGVTYISFSG